MINNFDTKKLVVERKHNVTSKVVWLLVIAVLIFSLSACNKGKPVAKIYQYEDGELTELIKNVYEDDEGFLIDMINNYYSLGNATGMENPNFAIVYNEGEETEYTYLLIVDLETNVITMITDTYNETVASRLLNSNTTALEFYDYVAE